MSNIRAETLKLLSTSNEVATVYYKVDDKCGCWICRFVAPYCKNKEEGQTKEAAAV